nr:hypothetical protein [Pandoravirus aubagnensis]
MAYVERPPMHPDLIRILGDLAPSRLFAAFEGDDALRATPRSLFDLCLRASVPFAVVNSILQANLPSHLCRLVLVPPTRKTRSDVHATTDGCDRDGNDHVDDDKGDGNSIDHYQACPPRWVSCCGCTSRPPNIGASNQSVADDRCSARPLCPRGWLRRIGQREALRIAAWHWACVVAENVHDHEAYGPPERPSCAFYESDWEKAAGVGVRWHFERARGASGADRDTSGVYFHDGYRGRLTVFSIAACDALPMRCQFASSCDSRFAVHPLWPRARVRVDYGDGVPVCLAVFVAGDPLFVGHKEV